MEISVFVTSDKSRTPMGVSPIPLPLYCQGDHKAYPRARRPFGDAGCATYLAAAGGDTTCTSIFPICTAFWVLARDSSRAGRFDATFSSRCRTASIRDRVAGTGGGANGAKAETCGVERTDI